LVGAKAVSLSTVSLGAGCVYASLGIVHFIRTLAKLSGERPPWHAPCDKGDKSSSKAVHNGQEEQDASFPLPRWLSWRVLNWAVIGRAGAGKSSLINALRGLKPRENGAAPVGSASKPEGPKAYMFQGDLARFTRMARLWDLPSAGSKDWPCTSYVKDAGLRHFDGVLIVTSGEISEFEESLLKELRDYQVPCYLVRNKVDQDVMNNAQDNEMSAEETLRFLRCELSSVPARSFLVSARHPDCAKFDFQALLHAMADDVASQRAALPAGEEPPELERLCGLPPEQPCQEAMLPLPWPSFLGQEAPVDDGAQADARTSTKESATSADDGELPANAFLWAMRPL